MNTEYQMSSIEEFLAREAKRKADEEAKKKAEEEATKTTDVTEENKESEQEDKEYEPMDIDEWLARNSYKAKIVTDSKPEPKTSNTLKAKDVQSLTETLLSGIDIKPKKPAPEPKTSSTSQVIESKEIEEIQPKKQTGKVYLDLATTQVFKVSDITVYFGDKQCIESLERKLRRLGAPDTPIIADFEGCEIVEGSTYYILQKLKELNCYYKGLSERDTDIAERYYAYKIYKTTPQNYKDEIDLQVGEIVILTDGLFYTNERSRVAKILKVEDTGILVEEFYVAMFRTDSPKLETCTQSYFFNDLYLEKPFIHRPVKEEREFITSVFIKHKYTDYIMRDIDDQPLAEFEIYDSREGKIPFEAKALYSEETGSDEEF